MSVIPIKRALLSVSDKNQLVGFAQTLHEQGVELISTGGTSKALNAANLPFRPVEDLTGLPEMLGGRVKTLHPGVHGGILGKRDEHADQGIAWIDLVVVNFYPFDAAVKPGMPWKEAVEFIDIGGPTMVRGAAKNFAWVVVVTDPSDYQLILTELAQQGGVSFNTRKKLAEKAFALTSRYDAVIQQFFAAATSDEPQNERFPAEINLQLKKHAELRYGENPHQQACAYQLEGVSSGMLSARQVQGKPLSYNNILDAEAAWACVNEFDTPACVIVKHGNPCGAAINLNIDQAYTQAHQADPVSAFGGITALNRPCTKFIAEKIAEIFMEVVLAPAYTEEALAILAKKPNLRVLTLPLGGKPQQEWRFIPGGVLIQDADQSVIQAADLKIVTRTQPKQADIETMLFAWRVLKHIKSNGILLAKENVTVGMGAGQVSRIDAVEMALRKAGEKAHGAVLASDAFFPFRDSIDRLVGSGIVAVIQPGGSVRDEEVIAACDEAGIAMVFTGKRCFRH